MIYAQGNPINDGNGQPVNAGGYFSSCYRLEFEEVRASLR
jgi:hypothetical protein